jgi:hypothetical protein
MRSTGPPARSVPHQRGHQRGQHRWSTQVVKGSTQVVKGSTQVVNWLPLVQPARWHFILNKVDGTLGSVIRKCFVATWLQPIASYVTEDGRHESWTRSDDTTCVFHIIIGVEYMISTRTPARATF